MYIYIYIYILEGAYKLSDNDDSRFLGVVPENGNPAMATITVVPTRKGDLQRVEGQQKSRVTALVLD